VISFEDSGHGVNVDLARGRARGEGTDRLVTRAAALVTTRFADVVTGTGRGDDIGTGSGDDKVRSGGGADFVLLDGPALVGRGGDDTARLGKGSDSSYSGSGSDQANGQDGGDIIVDQGRSADFLDGGLGRDSIDDRLVTSGEQRLVGGPAGDSGRDELSLTRTGSRLLPGAWDMTTGALTVGDDPTVSSVVRGFKETILPPGIAWVVDGSPRSETVLVFTGKADITYYGRGGRDEFFGARGDDTFDGGAGVDYAIDMGRGQDTCINVEDFGADDRCETKL
jgi:Ca2+-binding RTX toxin-like protein